MKSPNNTKYGQMAIFGIAWKTLETFIVNALQTLIFIILARILLPEDFGVVAIVAAFVGISNIFVSSGLGTALIQKENIDELDRSSVLFFSTVIACLIYVIIFFSSSYIAGFYEENIIEDILKIYSVSIIFSAVTGVQKSVLIRKLAFKEIFFVSSFAVLISGSISIFMALNDYGVYALVFNSLMVGFLSIFGFSIYMKWIPKLIFSYKRLCSLLRYAYKLLLANLIDVFYINMFPILIGKSFNTELLGYYNNGRQIPALIFSSINGSVNSVTFSLYSKYQNDLENLKQVVRKTIVISNFSILPIMVFLIFLAEPIVVTVLTDKWIFSVPYLQFFCLVYGLHHQHTIAFQAIAAIGRSEIFLKYEIFKKAFGIIVFLYTLQFDLIAIVIGQFFVAIFSILISTFPNKKILKYGFYEQFIDFMPYILLSSALYFFLIYSNQIDIAKYQLIIFQLVIGSLLYFLLSFLFRIKGYYIFKQIMNVYLITFFKKFH